MATLREDLIAAKALIDTPEKMDAVGSVRAACDIACGSETRIGRLRALETFGAFLDEPGEPNPAGCGYVVITLKSIMDRFDRAIARAS